MAHEMNPQHLLARTLSLVFTVVFVISIFITDDLLRQSLMILAGLPQLILMPAIWTWAWQSKVRKCREEVLKLFVQ